MTRATKQIFLLPFFLCLGGILALLGCSESTPKRRVKVQEAAIETPPKEVESVEPTIVPPWQTWSFDEWRAGFERASQHARVRNFPKEIQEYESIERQTSVPSEERFEALTRRMGAMLKLGRSKEVLSEVSRYSETNGKPLDQLGPYLSLVIAFAYEHQRDIDQTFAWLSLANRGGAFVVSSRAREEASRLMRKIRSDAFASYAARWDADPFIAGLFQIEATRRRLGGGPIDDLPPDWFSPLSYAPGAKLQPRAPESDPSPSVVNDNSPVIGAVLSLSGQYTEHSSRVQSGIELALEQYDHERRLRVVYGDDGGDPESAAREYDKLASEHGASIVLGPLLVKSAELVAARSQSARVPFLTFTKRRGITTLSPVAFRLGVTAENQLSEAIEYARKERQSLRFASLSTPASSEFLASFRDIVSKAGGEVVSEGIYQPSDPSSLQGALAEIQANTPDAIFFPDSLEKALPAIQQIRESSLKNALLIGPAAWDDPVFIRGYGTVLDGTLFVTPFYTRSQRRDVVEFLELYQRRFGKAPDLLSAQAFDAARIVVEAQNQKGGSLAERLKNLPSVMGVTGELKVNGDGEIVRRMSVVQVQRGDTVEVMVGGVPTGSVPVSGEMEGRSARPVSLNE